MIPQRAGRLPEWIREAYRQSASHETRAMLRSHGLHTVCEEARCPNRAECFKKPTATFLILGDRCTRACRFCSVDKAASVPLPDPDEPRRVAEAAREMGLRFAVVTSVTRDDLPDGGAGHFAATIRALREALPEVKVEVLIPDFLGNESALATVLAAEPDVLNHNVETVPSLYARVRPQAVYTRSIGLLRASRRLAPHIATKSGLMLGLGETLGGVRSVLRDLRGAGCDYVTIGQYLRPRKDNLPVAEYVHPDAFRALGREAMDMGFAFVASAPLVRSSMNAEEMYSSSRGE
jgi:lipoic acid synthetase